MSKINPRNYQLGLAFNDADLKKPKHDEIMHWLSAWCRDPENIRGLLRPTYRSRSIRTFHKLSHDGEATIAALKEYEQQSMRSALERLHKWEGAAFEGKWEAEPTVALRHLQSEWELPLKDERGVVMGFADIYCGYEIDDVLFREVTKEYDLNRPATPQRYPHEKWMPVEVRETPRFKAFPTRNRLFFEVKTEIDSIGNLMRQLQTYRASATFRGQEAANRMIVVAPSHNGAAAVCQDHGILFLEYRPY